MNSKPACIHRILDGNIREFVLTEVSRRALDELFDMTEQNIQEGLDNHLPDAAAPVLIDSSVGVQPVNYSFIRLKAMMTRFPSRRKGRIAIILPAGPLTKTISVMLRPIVPVRIYIANERDEAVSWLREPVAANTKR